MTRPLPYSFVLAGAAVLLCLAIPSPLQSQAKTPAKDPIILKGAPMGGVKFQHKLHVERAANKCETCHHASKPELPSKAPQQACSECHTKPLKAGMKTTVQGAFHAPTAKTGLCIDCHQKEIAKGKKAPSKCVECHRKDNL